MPLLVFLIRRLLGPLTVGPGLEQLNPAQNQVAVFADFELRPVDARDLSFLAHGDYPTWVALPLQAQTICNFRLAKIIHKS